MNRYRIKNWPKYNRSMINHGSINFWFSEEAISKWHSSAHAEAIGHERPD